MTPAPAPTPQYPLDAINFDQDAANSGFYHIPPDPIGAVSFTHLVNVVNTSIEWYLRQGGYQEHSGSLSSFFSSLSPANNGFDPKVIYDQYEDRFLVVTLEKVESGSNPDAGNTSRILLAVSMTSDPNDGWCFQAIDGKFNDGTYDYWSDYPGFAVDEQAVYITNNLFQFSGGTGAGLGPRLWILDKGVGSGGLYDNDPSCGTSSYTVQDPGGFGATTQPAHVYGDGGVPGSIGTFLVQYSGLSDGTNEAVHVMAVTDPLGTPGFPGITFFVGDIDNTAAAMPNAPQLGTSVEIETNDRRVLNAVWRNGSLWLTAQVVPGSGVDAGQATVHWWEIDTASAPTSYSLVQQGNVGGEDLATGTYTYMPSIAVNVDGSAAIGFSYSAESLYPGAAYTWHEAGDAAGTVQESVDYAPGEDYYIRTFGGSRNRWGDFSGTVVDFDDFHFCFFNEYAMARGTAFGGEDGRWATRWACTNPGADLSISKSDDPDPDPVEVGANVTYTITVDNDGPLDAVAVVATDYLDHRTTFVSTSGCLNAPGYPDCELGDLVAGGTAVYTLVASVNVGTAPGTTLTNAVGVDSDTLDPNGENQSTEIPTSVIAAEDHADVTLGKTDSPDPVIAGNQLTYTLTVNNLGPDTASAVWVSDGLPSGVSGATTSGCDEDPNGVPACSLGDIASGGNASYTITVTVDPDTTGIITNSATVLSGTDDPNPDDNNASEDTTVTTSADLSIAKTDDPDPVQAGASLTYTITVDNAGPSDAQGVVVTDTLPTQATLVSTTGCSEDPNGAPTCSLGTIPAGGQKIVTITATVDAGTADGTVLTNSAGVDSNTPDPVPGNDSASEQTTVSAPSALRCDANGDGAVDRLDIVIISRARGQVATGPDDPRDGNRDGRISTGDVHYCIPQCDLPSCAIAP